MKKLPIAFVLLLLTSPAATHAADEGYKAVLDDQIPLHRAIKETLALIEKNPNDASLHNDLGALLAWNGTYPNALESFAKAAELDKKDAKPLFNAGLVEVLKGNWHTARKRFQQATRREPGNFQAWWMVGWTEERLENTDAAVDAYKHAVVNDTTLWDIRRNPFAATTRLKGRVLLETYRARVLKTTLPLQEQFEDPARMESFFQRSRPAAAPAAPPSAAPQAPAAAPLTTPPGGPPSAPSKAPAGGSPGVPTVAPPKAPPGGSPGGSPGIAPVPTPHAPGT